MPPKRTYTPAGMPTVTESNTTKASTEQVGEPLHRTTPTEPPKDHGSTYTYIAMKPITVNGVKRQPGAAVPEAESWRNVHNYVSTGHLAVVLKGS